MRNHPLMISVASMISLIVMAVATSSIHVAVNDVHWIRIVIACSLVMGVVFFLHHCWTLVERGLEKRFKTCQLIVVFGILPFVATANIVNDFSYNMLLTDIERNMATYDIERFIMAPVREHALHHAHLIIGEVDTRSEGAEHAPSVHSNAAEEGIGQTRNPTDTFMPRITRSHSMLALVTAEPVAPELVTLRLDGLTDFSCRGISWTMTKPWTFQVYDLSFQNRNLAAVARDIRINGEEWIAGGKRPNLREMHRLCSSDGQVDQKHSMEISLLLRPTVVSDPPPQGVL